MLSLTGSLGGSEGKVRTLSAYREVPSRGRLLKGGDISAEVTGGIAPSRRTRGLGSNIDRNGCLSEGV